MVKSTFTNHKAELKGILSNYTLREQMELTNDHAPGGRLLPAHPVRVMLIFEDVMFPLWNHLFLCYPCYADFKTASVFKIGPI